MSTILTTMIGLVSFVSVSLDLFFLLVLRATLRKALRCDWINGFEEEALCAAACANEIRSREDALEKQN